MADIEFFLDPICPWAWITSRFVVEVRDQRGIEVDWRSISLRMVNAERDYQRDFPPHYVRMHTLGTSLLRVFAAGRDAVGGGAAGNEVVDLAYTVAGEFLHRDGGSARLAAMDDDAFADAVAELLEHTCTGAGVDPALAAAADDDRWDDVLRTETTEALRRTGDDVGTPIITWDPSRPEATSLFGPVIDHIPRGADAVRLWDALAVVARTPGLAELKRSLRGHPRFD